MAWSIVKYVKKLWFWWIVHNQRIHLRSFLSWWLGLGRDMRLIFSKNVGLRRDILGRSACWNRGGFGKLRFWGHFEKVRGRKWRWRTLDILSDRFWNYFSQFQGNCKENGCGLGFLRILFLYRIQPPIFPIGVALFFHMALFFHVELPINRPIAATSNVDLV